MKFEEEKEKNSNIQEKIKQEENIIKDAFINSLEKKIKENEEKIVKLQLSNNEEIINLNKRLYKEIEKSKKFALEKLIIEFLPVIDNIERALNAIKEKKEKYYLEIIEKINFIFSLLQEVLNEFNVSKINQKNILFNPDIHQAMSIHYTNEIQDNYIFNIMQSGYILHKTRLLRPAMVIVSKNKK